MKSDASPTSKLCIVRGGGWQDALRSYKVFLDGQLVGELKRNSELALPVPQGLHTVQLRIDWLGSPEVAVRVGVGQTRLLSCRPADRPSSYWIHLQADEDQEGVEQTYSHRDTASAQPRGPGRPRSDRHDRGAQSGRGADRPPPPPSLEPWYRVLGVSVDASPDEIRAAYRKLRTQYHPDKVAHLGAELIALAEAKSKLINRAYEEGSRVLNGKPKCGSPQ